MYMTSVIPGFVELRDLDWVQGGWNLPRDVDMFQRLLNISLQYASVYDGKRLIKIDTLNDFGEGHSIEPTVEEKFAYLQALKETLLLR